MSYRRAMGGPLVAPIVIPQKPKPPTKPWIPGAPVAVPGVPVAKGTWVDTPEGPVWIPEGTPPPPDATPPSEGGMVPVTATSVAQSPSGVPVLLVVGALGVAGFLVYRHFKKKGTSS